MRANERSERPSGPLKTRLSRVETGPYSFLRYFVHILNGKGLSDPLLMRFMQPSFDSFVRFKHSLFVKCVKDSCKQSGVNTIESLQVFFILCELGEFWPPFERAMFF